MFYWVTKYTLGLTLKIVFRPRAWGVKNVPRQGPAILASNHLSFSDHFFAPLPLPRKVVFLAKSEYFTGRGIKGLLSRVFFSGRSPKTAALMVDLVPCEAVFRPPDTLRPERGQAFAMEV